MKKVTTQSLHTDEDDAFSKAAAEETQKATTMRKKTFTLSERDLEQINSAAAALSQQQNKPVGASEALRHLLDRMREVQA